jgi:dienelactone hydrolase
MANVILFHSMLGLRETERRFATQLSAAGHTVNLPDLYEGATTDDLDEGFEIKRRMGWDVICKRAREALDSTPENAVLAGISMGAGVVSEMWPWRPTAPKVMLLHGLADVPLNARAGLPIQLHISDTDPFFPASGVDAWHSVAEAAGLNVQTFRYAHSGHYFSDPTSADHNPTATFKLWERILNFIA